MNIIVIIISALILAIISINILFKFKKVEISQTKCRGEE